MNAEDTGFKLQSSDPKVSKAMEALDELERWLEKPPSDFVGWYEVTMLDPRADLKLRPFWKRHLHK